MSFASQRSSSETQGFNGEGDGKESGSEVFLVPISFPPPFPLKPWVSEDAQRSAILVKTVARPQFVSDFCSSFATGKHNDLTREETSTWLVNH